MNYLEECKIETEKSITISKYKNRPYYKEYYVNENGNIPPYFARNIFFKTNREISVYGYGNMLIDKETNFIVYVSGNEMFETTNAIERNNVLIKSLCFQREMNMTENQLRKKCIEVGGIL